MIVPISKIINKAKKQGYAVGAFNTSNLEITLAIIRAAVAQKSPVIIQTSQSAIKYSNNETLFAIMTTLANTVGKSVPIAIHLDHGKDFGMIKDCINVGYNSVHIDASEEKFDKNIKLTKQITKLAHKKKLWVQAELGAILGKEGMLKLKTGEINMEEMMTDPAEAAEFVAQTKVDTLAIAVGTIHGHFKGIEKVDQPRLQEIAKLVKVPLVLHGGSGLSAPVFKKAIKNGVSVINIDTNLRIAFKNALQKSVNAKMDKIDPRKILAPSTDAMQAEVEKMIKIFGSSNKA
ncbi:class II fructose-bisphosphate aldolase [bacterium]|mgnify:CR=1 FL=1|jgi:fructose-bisphosphate aldolase class II|nr:class II fructose-bisphosphate aldolase [bacterium]